MITITAQADLDKYCSEIKQFPHLAGDQEMRSLHFTPYAEAYVRKVLINAVDPQA